VRRRPYILKRETEQPANHTTWTTMTIQSWGRPRWPASIGTHAHAARSPKLHADKPKSSEDSSLKSRIREKKSRGPVSPSVTNALRFQKNLADQPSSLANVRRFRRDPGKTQPRFRLEQTNIHGGWPIAILVYYPVDCPADLNLLRAKSSNGRTAWRATGHSASAWLSTWRVWMATAPVRGR
jgi:hypothetical protein